MRLLKIFICLGLITTAASAQDKLPPFFPSGVIIEKSDSLRLIEENENALALLQQIHPGDTNYVAAQLKISSTLLDMKRYNEAIEICRKGMDLPNSDQTKNFWLNLGYALDLNGEKQEALDAYKALAQAYPFYRSATNNLAYQHLNLEHFDSSYVAFQNQARKYPFDDNAHFNLGVFALNEGHFTEAFLALNMAIMLAPYRDRAFSILNTLNEVANNTKIDRKPKPGFELGSNEFEDIDLLFENYVALKKGYKTGSDVDLYVAKQNHLIFSQLKETESSPYFYNEFYKPFYESIMDEGKYDVMQLFLLIPSQNETHKKLVEKRIKELKEFNSWFRLKWYQLNDVQTFDYEGVKGKFKTWYYGNADIEVISAFKDDKENSDGLRVYFNEGGIVSGKGNFNNGERQGEWLYYFPSGAVKQRINFVDGVVTDSAFIYYENGKISERLFFVNNERNGAFKSYYKSGTRYQTGTYKDNTLHGETQYFFANGDLEYIYDLKMGKEEGELIEYYSNGNIYRKEFYTDGLSNGTYEIFWPDNSKQVTAQKVNGKFEGKYTSYHFNGAVKTEGNYAGGVQDGEWKEYHSNGKVKLISPYSKGLLNGTGKEYTPSGVLLSEKDYQSDYTIGYRFYNDSGELLAESGHKKNAFTYKSFFPNGQLEMEGQYQSGVGMIGPWKTYDAYGNLEKTYSYDKGKLEGEYTEYRPWGDVLKKYTYKDGKSHGYYEEYSIGGQLIKQGYVMNGDYEGNWLTYYPDGTLKEESYYLEGYLVGPKKVYAVNGKLDYIEENQRGTLHAATYFDSTGAVLNSFSWPYSQGIYERNHYNGKPDFRGKYCVGRADSVFTWYDADGKVETTGQYKSNQKNGEWKWFHDNGKIETIGTYINGSKNGVWKDFYDDGSLKEESHFVYGTRVGKNIDYYQNGKIKQVISYADSEFDGEFAFYDDTGMLEVCREYDLGILKSYYYLSATGDTVRTQVVKGTCEITGKYPNEKPARTFKIEKGIFVGPYQEFHSNGTKLSDYQLVNDERHGVYKEFFSNGNPRNESHYLYGTLHGPFTAYHENGKIKKTYTYVNGEKHGTEIEYDQNGKLLGETVYYNGKVYGKK